MSLPASRVYRYVGPEHVLERVADLPPGARITRAEELVAWLRAQGSREEEVTATFTVGLDGVLCVADRHAEHVACAGFRPVLAAGEMTFAGDPPEVVGVTNQSTGYCPEPECWRAVAAALDRAGFRRPDGWTAAFVFRRCPACGQRNLVKDDWWRCAVCDAGLPRGWNF
ncbi:MAG: hypothetical protein H6739_06520 [Alphaproteobacteria bacterium]|nr:hypothetical protein [Alphaproteobacteria bacterium]